MNWTTALIALIAAISFYYTLSFPLHHDLAGWVLTGAISVELGEQFRPYYYYYPAIEKLWFETAVRLGHSLGIGADAAVLAQTHLAVFLSAYFGYHIRRTTNSAGLPFLGSSFLILLLIPVVYANVFGLREHLVVLGLWPYFILRASDENVSEVEPRLKVAIGVWLGFFLSFKYLYCLVVLFVELFDAVAQRSARPLFRLENLIAAGVVLVYLFLWLGIDSDQMEAIPQLQQSMSAFFNADQTREIVLINLGVGIFILGSCYLINVQRRAVIIGLAALLGATAVLWVQQRGFTHHTFPVTMAIILWWWIIGARLPKWTHVALALILFFEVYLQHAWTDFFRAQVKIVSNALRDSGVSVVGKRVAVASQHVPPYNQVLLSEGGLRWTPSSNIAYVSNEFSSFDQPENVGLKLPPMQLSSPGARKLHNQLMQFWQDYPPDILILDRGHRWPLRYIDINWKEILLHDPRFETLINQFTLVSSVCTKRGSVACPYHVSFDLYVRTTDLEHTANPK